MSVNLFGWLGVAFGIGGLVAYFAIVLRQPKTVRMMNGAGLLLSSLALFPSRMMTAIAHGPFAFAVATALVFMMLSVAVQTMSGWRNRRAWDGVERRRRPEWDGVDRRAGEAWDGADRRAGQTWDGADRRGEAKAWDGADRRTRRETEA